VSFTACTLTPIFWHRSRSTLTYSCGAALEYDEKTNGMPGFWAPSANTWAIRLRAAPSSTALPAFCRSSTCILNPPALPRPRMGGDGNTCTSASRMTDSRLFRSATICSAPRPLRRSKVSSVR
jgi:hypothetical protein